MDFTGVNGFDWDAGNIEKNKVKHHIDWWIVEEIFLNETLIIAIDENHSNNEIRYYALGKADNLVLLFVVFTVRNGKIRVISARKMSKKERAIYEKY